MGIKDMRKLKVEELVAEELKQRDEYSKARAAVSKGKEKDVKKSLKIKRNLARILTVIREKEMLNN